MNVGLTKELNGYLGDVRDLVLGRKPAGATYEYDIIEASYAKKPSLLNRQTWYFYRALKQVVGERYAILTCVPLPAILKVESVSDDAYRESMRKIHNQTIDFLICDPASLRPRVGITLEGAERLPGRHLTAEALGGIFQEAELPLLFVPVAKEYDPYVLRDALLEMLAQSRETTTDWEASPA